MITLTAVGVAFAVLEVALLAGAAFAVGARKQQRSLAIVASSGGQRGNLFQIVSAGGVVLGTAGGIIGLGLGIAAGSVFMAVTADGSATQYWGYHLSIPVMVGVALFAVVVGWLSALVPAWAASRMDVLAALRGARRPPRPSRRRPWVGAALVVVGIGATLGAAAIAAAIVTPQGSITNMLLYSVAGIAVFAGPILAQAGAILLAPRLLRLSSRASAGMGLGARLSTRDAARNPSRSVPALAAIMGAVFLGTAVIGFTGSSEAQVRQTYEYFNAQGQVVVELNGWDTQTGLSTVFPIGDEVADVLESQLGASEVRVLSGEKSFQLYSPSDDTLVAELGVPPELECEPTTEVPDPYAGCAAHSYVLVGTIGPENLGRLGRRPRADPQRSRVRGGAASAPRRRCGRAISRVRASRRNDGPRMATRIRPVRIGNEQRHRRSQPE